jgi:hypothetical protein
MSRLPATAAYDAVDESSTRRVSAMDVGAVKAPTSEELWLFFLSF